ncbi:hypothetical protein [Thermaurantimonas aggregans]|uniref:hypothetical protein n=1 Tax=Thermaurantimonas aggregans TaxID=2173829 RepID=UPI00135B93DF|nr:hypothetical protein [Thermaurantimonas aggregans]
MSVFTDQPAAPSVPYAHPLRLISASIPHAASGAGYSITLAYLHLMLSIWMYHPKSQIFKTTNFPLNLYFIYKRNPLWPLMTLQIKSIAFYKPFNQ